MPINKKGALILKKMQQTYGKKRGKQVFYASKNAGTIAGVENKKKVKTKKRK